MTARTRLRVAASLGVLTLGALMMLVVATATLFLARRFYSEVIGRAIGRAILALWGVRYRVLLVGGAEIPRRQTVYVANHTSTLDAFLLIAMGLPRTRFFLSGFLRRGIPPLGIIGMLIRIFWTVPQEFPERRRRIFARAARILARTGDSVFLSPEGMRVLNGEIGRFNKGAFHLATSLAAPIVPIYFRIPSAIDPGMGYEASAGLVDVYVLPAIDTSGWTVAEVERNRDRVHELFVRVNDSVRSTGATPANLALEPVAPQPEGVLV